MAKIKTKIKPAKKENLFGTAFKQIMHHKGLTGYKLEQISGVPSAMIYRITTGQQRFPTFPTFFKLSKALGYRRPDEMLTEVCNIIEFLHKKKQQNK